MKNRLFWALSLLAIVHVLLGVGLTFCGSSWGHVYVGVGTLLLGLKIHAQLTESEKN